MTVSFEQLREATFYSVDQNTFFYHQQQQQQLKCRPAQLKKALKSKRDYQLKKKKNFCFYFFLLQKSGKFDKHLSFENVPKIDNREAP